MQITPQFQSARPTARPPHEMLSLTKDKATGVAHVRINFSSLDVIQTCLRKAYFSLACDLEPNEPSPALAFGTATHKALEVWYCAPRDSRRTGQAVCDDFQAALLAGQEPPTETQHGSCVRCSAIARFLTEAECLRDLPQDDKRSLENGTEILNSYFDHYKDDPYVIARDAEGPLCERPFEHLLIDLPQIKITYFGTIDVILKNDLTGQTIVADHKTTWSLGKDFLAKIKPNHQYTGYVLGANAALGIKTQNFLVNGIQVAKLKRAYARQVTTRTPEDFDELRAACYFACRAYITCLTSDVWPQTAPGPCSAYGSCTFRDLCEQPHALRKSLMESMFKKRNPTK